MLKNNIKIFFTLTIFFSLFFNNKFVIANSYNCEDMAEASAILRDLTKYSSATNDFSKCKNNVELASEWVSWVLKNQSSCSCVKGFEFIESSYRDLLKTESSDQLKICKSHSKTASKKYSAAIFYFSQCKAFN